MEDSFFEYRNDTSDKLGSDSDEVIDGSFVEDQSFTLLKQVPVSAKKNKTLYVAESDDAGSGDDTESYDEGKEVDAINSMVGRSSAAASHINSSSDGGVKTRGNMRKQSDNSFTQVVLSSSSDEEVSPEIVPKRRVPLKPRVSNSSSDSPLIRKVRKRMILTDSENDNSIIIENEKNKKQMCLKDTPLKIDVKKSTKENMITDDESGDDNDESDDDDEDGDDDEEVGEEEEGPDEDEMVMSRATRMSIMGVVPNVDADSDESDFIQSDESNLKSVNSIAGSTTSLEHTVPLTSPKPSLDNSDDLDNLPDVTLISPKTVDLTKGMVTKAFSKNMVKEESIDLTVLDDGDKSDFVPKPMDDDDDDDDEVKIIDKSREVIALSSEDEAEPTPRVTSSQTLKQYLMPASRPNQGVTYVKKKVRDTELAKLEGLRADLKNVSKLMEGMELSSLPDRGSKLKSRLANLKRQVDDQAEKVANMVVEPEVPTEAQVAADGFGDQGLTWDDIQKASNQVQPRMFGKQAMSTHMAERNLILDRLRDLHASLDSRPPESEHAPQPRLLKTTLMTHQLHALAWLLWRETQRPRGGILADDMGLGKTITMISLILSSKEQNLEPPDDDDDDDDGSGDDGWRGKENSKMPLGGTLVVCPASLLQQWQAEVTSHCAPHALSVLLHHGASRVTAAHRVASHDLVVTTYNLLQRDNEKKGVLMRVRWSRVILDEAHIVRNYKSATSAAVSAVTARARWCLTGTPVQNKDLDVYALLKFLRCTPFSDLNMWKKWIDNKSLGGQERLATVMRCLLLRRTKLQLQARGHLDCLPDRTRHDLPVTLTSDEMNVYQKVLVFSKTLFAQFLQQRAEKQADLYPGSGSGSGSGKNDAYDKMHKRMVALHGAKPVKSHEILVLLLRLRQVCCHCGLIAAMLDSEDVESGAPGAAGDQGSLDLLTELNKLTLEEKRKSKEELEEEEREEEESEPQEGTTVAEAMRSVLSPNNPVFDLSRESSKIQAVIKCLTENVFTNKGDKAVVVSQWTGVLKLVERSLTDQGVRSVTLSGQVPVPARAPLIQQINDPRSTVKVMLLSLCAGGVGLNLCGANHLLLLDPHWNPQLEEQAQDRVYRVGQRKHVHIYRFMCVETVEQSIRTLQQVKLDLAENVLTGAKQNASKVSIEDLKILFNMGPS